MSKPIFISTLFCLNGKLTSQSSKSSTVIFFDNKSFIFWGFIIQCLPSSSTPSLRATFLFFLSSSKKGKLKFVLISFRKIYGFSRYWIMLLFVIRGAVIVEYSVKII